MTNQHSSLRLLIRSIWVLLVGVFGWGISSCSIRWNPFGRLPPDTVIQDTVAQDTVINGNSTSIDAPIENPDIIPPKNTNPAINFEAQWIVSADQAIHFIHQGATVLDAQGRGLGLKRFPGAAVVSWQQFAHSEMPDRGKLLADDDQLTTMLQDVGIERDRPVVVFANPPRGWGEAGRIVWMLRTLGHPKAVMVDGGIQALLAKTTPAQRRSIGDAIATNTLPAQGNFIVDRASLEENTPRHDWDITHSELKSLLSRQPIIIVDTREPREYAGATPYGESRGGHIPGAINLYFKDLLADDGTLLLPTELHAQLAAHGITPETVAIAYCTGGIRSAWLTTVLVSHGYQVQNYAGSMWEWSALPPENYPLVF